MGCRIIRCLPSMWVILYLLCGVVSHSNKYSTFVLKQWYSNCVTWNPRVYMAEFQMFANRKLNFDNFVLLPTPPSLCTFVINILFKWNFMCQKMLLQLCVKKEHFSSQNFCEYSDFIARVLRVLTAWRPLQQRFAHFYTLITALYI